MPPAAPVSGDLPATVNRQEAAIGAPVMTPVAKVSTFSGASASTRAGMSRMR